MSLAPWGIEPVLELAALDAEAQLRHLVGWAVLAANSHNSQPWRFVLRPASRTIELYLDAEGLTPASDPTGRQSTIGIGCALENLRLAAHAYGLGPVVARGEPGPGPLASVQLTSAPRPALAEGDLATLGALRERRVNRSKYQATAVPEAFLRRLAENADACGVRCELLQDKSTRLAISELQYMADRAVIAVPAFRHELQRFFIENHSAAGRGMPGATFGMSDEMTARVVADLGTTGLFNPDWANGFAMAGRDGIRSAPLVAVVTCAHDAAAAWLDAGVFFQRSAVDAQREGLAVAVHAALVESAGLNALLRARLATLARPTLVFRVGYASQPRPHAPRLPASATCVVER
jgi:hypothetical protein